MQTSLKLKLPTLKGGLADRAEKLNLLRFLCQYYRVIHSFGRSRGKLALSYHHANMLGRNILEFNTTSYRVNKYSES